LRRQSWDLRARNQEGTEVGEVAEDLVEGGRRLEVVVARTAAGADLCFSTKIKNVDVRGLFIRKKKGQHTGFSAHHNITTPSKIPCCRACERPWPRVGRATACTTRRCPAGM